MRPPLTLLLLGVLIPCRPSAMAQAGPVHEYRISGVVVSARDGSALSRCKVTVSPAGPRRGGGQPGGQRGQIAVRGGGGQFPPGGSQDESVLTDAGGHFSLTVKSAGTWRVTGAARGFRTQALDEQDGFFAGVVVSDATPEVTIKLQLTPDASISGTVFDEVGDPVRDAQVSVELAVPPDPVTAGGRAGGPPARSVGSAQTDFRGHYEISPLPPGNYRVSVRARPWYATASNGITGFDASSGDAEAGPDPLDVVFPRTWYPAATDEGSAGTIALEGGEDREADLHLTPVSSVHLLLPRGQSSASPTTNAAVNDAPRVTPLNGSGGGIEGMSMRLTRDGTQWDIGGLTPGNYEVRTPTGNGGNNDFRTAQVTVAAGFAHVVSSDTLAEGTPITLRAEGAKLEDLRSVTLADVNSGTPYQSGGRRVRRGADEPAPEGDSSRTLRVHPGQYRVLVAGQDGQYLTGLAVDKGSVSGNVLTVGDQAAVLTLRLASGRATLGGVVRLEGQPTEGALVLLVPASFGQPDAIATVLRDESNTDGSFTLASVLPGPYILVAIDHGWQVNWRDPATLSQYLVKGVPVELNAGATVNKDAPAVSP